MGVVKYLNPVAVRLGDGVHSRGAPRGAEGMLDGPGQCLYA